MKRAKLSIDIRSFCFEPSFATYYGFPWLLTEGEKRQYPYVAMLSLRLESNYSEVIWPEKSHFFSSIIDSKVVEMALGIPPVQLYEVFVKLKAGEKLAITI